MILNFYYGYAEENESYKIELKQIFNEPSEKQGKLLFALAKKLEANDQGSEAIDIYRQLIAPDSSLKRVVRAWLAIAEIYRKNSQYQESLKELDALNILLPMNKEVQKMKFKVLVEMAIASENVGNHKESRNYFGLAFAVAPENHLVILREYADQLMLNGQMHLAIPLYQEILKSNLSAKDMRLARLDLAQAYVSTNQFSLALEEYEKILSDNPQDCQVRSELVDLYINFARNDAKNFNHISSLNWYLNAIALDPSKRVSLLREYADEVSKGGDGPEAISLYKQILISGSLSPADARLTNLGLAQTYIWMNNHEEALKIYDLLLKINPRDQEARRGKAQVYVDYARFDSGQGKRALAIEWFRKAIEVDSNERSKFIKELADQLRYNSQVDEAIALYKEILDGKPGGNYERETRLILAEVYAKKFQYDDALKEYDYLLQQNKYDAIVKQSKAKVYLDYAHYNAKHGKHKEAIEWYYKAIENDPIIRPEILINIEDERAILGDKDNTPISKEELQFKACSLNEEPKIEKVTPILPVSQPSSVPQPPLKEEYKNVQRTETPSSSHPTELQKSEPAAKIEVEEERHAPELHNKNNPSAQPRIEINNFANDCAKWAFEDAMEYAKYLQVFEANRAFEASLEWDPENINYREHYAWHLHTFLFLSEGLAQFDILLPRESEKTPYYEVLGWDNRRVGRLNESICAFSNIYDFPHFLTLSDQFTVINELYRDVYLTKINALWNSRLCADKVEAYEIKKNYLNIITILESLKMLNRWL